jgi:hypothetical protein
MTAFIASGPSHRFVDSGFEILHPALRVAERGSAQALAQILPQVPAALAIFRQIHRNLHIALFAESAQIS